MCKLRDKKKDERLRSIFQHAWEEAKKNAHKARRNKGIPTVDNISKAIEATSQPPTQNDNNHIIQGNVYLTLK